MANRRNAIWMLMITFMVSYIISGRTFFLNLFYVFMVMLAGSFIWAWIAIHWIRINRRTPSERAQVGRTFDERFRVVNTGFFPKLWLEVRDHSTLPRHRASHVVPFMLPKREHRWGVSTLCVKRGQFTLGPLTINSGDPFGLFQFPRHINAVSRVIVYPATVPIYEFASPIGRLSGGSSVRRRTYEVTTNASGIRDYAPGDSLNRIHWRTTARRGKLSVKEFELDPLSDVWIFIDFNRQIRFDALGKGDAIQAEGWQLPSNTEEYTVTCAASIAEYYISKGRAVGMFAYTPFRDVLQPDRGERQLDRILESLALAKSETDKTLSQVITIESDIIGRGSTVILITASLDIAWVHGAEALRRRGLHVVAVVINPISFDAPKQDFSAFLAQLDGAGVHTYTVKLYDNLTDVLSFDLVR